MALPLRPDVTTDDDHTVYSSLDATDEEFFNGLSSQHKRKFCEMIYRWREAFQPTQSALADGQAIVNRWKSRGCKLSKLRRMATVAAEAVPPLVADVPQAVNVQDDQPNPPQAGGPVTAPIPTTPVQSPLAELSPWFVCQSDVDNSLAPTKGQADFIAADLHAPWKFADVIFQKEPEGGASIAPLAPTMSVCLFVRPDQNGVIEEQLAVKCLEIHELANVVGRRSLLDANNEVEREVSIHRSIRSTNCSHVNRYRGHSVRETNAHVIMPYASDKEVRLRPRKTVHIYQDFAGCGNLKQFIDLQKEKNTPINEHFIWYTLRELTEALIALNQGPGHCSHPHEPATDLPASDEYKDTHVGPWVPILHLDIKTDNVFLEANNTDYPAYPKPVLADFGISCLGHEKNVDLQHIDSDVRNTPRFGGTDGWRPPERLEEALPDLAANRLSDSDYDYVPYTWRLSEKTDIWALGLIAHEMMYSHRTDTVDIRGDSIPVKAHTLSKEANWSKLLHKREVEAHESHFEVHKAELNHLPDGYSVRLCHLAAQCLRHNIEARPSLEQLLNICQQELSRLDNLPGSTSGKRKREDDTETRLHKFSRYEIGEVYRPKVLRTKVDLPEDGTIREQYVRLVDTWSNLQRPTTEDQANLIDAIDLQLLESDLVDESDTAIWEWAAKYLISCLRKRNDPKAGAYILTAEYIENEDGPGWIKRAFKPEVKTKILQNLLAWMDGGWHNDSTYVPEWGQDATNALRNAVEWGLLMLRDLATPIVRDAQGLSIAGGDPTEPREPRMKDQSSLHKGIHDWIFVTPTGAFYKN